jgi:6-phosphogluconolactonase (cycloisomerase 2 family)
MFSHLPLSQARLACLAIAIAAATAVALPSSASASSAPRPVHASTSAVFVQDDDPAGNAIVAYDRGADGTLTQAGIYGTGGLGGVLDGSVVDHLASQGSLTYDRQSRTLYAVNAGSDTITVFAVNGDRLTRTQVVSSGGTFPVSIAAQGHLVYVLNALDGGSIQGFYRLGHHLRLVSSWNRGLDLAAGDPQFTHTPGQVAFTPNGGKLVVTTKAGGQSIDVFRVGAFGRPAATPVVNDEASTVPFAVTFDATGRLVVAEAGTNAVATYTIRPSGVLVPVQEVPTGQQATCWIVRDRDYLYASNAGSANLSGFEDTGRGELGSLGTTTTDAGTVDAAVTHDGQFLYVQTGGAGIVDEFAVGADGALESIGSVTVPDAVGAEGIVAL